MGAFGNTTVRSGKVKSRIECVCLIQSRVPLQTQSSLSVKVIYSRELNCRQIVWSIQCGFEIGTRWKTPSRHPLVDKDIILIPLEEKYTELQQVVRWSFGLSVWSLPDRASLAFNQPSSERERERENCFLLHIISSLHPPADESITNWVTAGLVKPASVVMCDWTSFHHFDHIYVTKVSVVLQSDRLIGYSCHCSLVDDKNHEYEKWLIWSCRFESCFVFIPQSPYLWYENKKRFE